MRVPKVVAGVATQVLFTTIETIVSHPGIAFYKSCGGGILTKYCVVGVYTIDKNLLVGVSKIKIGPPQQETALMQ